MIAQLLKEKRNLAEGLRLLDAEETRAWLRRESGHNIPARRLRLQQQMAKVDAKIAIETERSRGANRGRVTRPRIGKGAPR